MRLLLIIALALCGLAQAETKQQKLDALNALPDVVGAQSVEQGSLFNGLFGELYFATVVWYRDMGEVVQKETGTLIIEKLGVVGEENVLGWLAKIPEVLAPVAETKYLSSRTAGGWASLTGAAQLSAITGFCNSVYAAANVGAGAIRELTAEPVDGSTIRVSGYFDLGTTWEQQTWYVRLIDPNGSVAAPYSNIEFQRRTAEVTAP